MGPEVGDSESHVPTCWSSCSLSSLDAILDANKGSFTKECGLDVDCDRVQERAYAKAGSTLCRSTCQVFIRKTCTWALTCCVVRLWPRVKSNAGSPDVERCKHVKSQATTVFFKLGTLRRVSTYVQHVWGIIGHVTAEAGNTVGTDGAPPQVPPKLCGGRLRG